MRGRFWFGIVAQAALAIALSAAVCGGVTRLASLPGAVVGALGAFVGLLSFSGFGMLRVAHPIYQTALEVASRTWQL